MEMLKSNWVEILGIIASLGVAISLTMTNVKKLRYYNLIGCALFASYGAMIGSISVFGVNAYIACVNLYYLIKMNKHKDYFSTLEVKSDNEFLHNFLSFWNKDMINFFPNYEIKKDDNIIVILRNALPVGLFVTRETQNGEAEIMIDYASPNYRDLGNAKYFFSQQSKILSEKGIKKLKINTDVKIHQKYLIQIGFEKLNSTEFIKSV
jgi:hypothetical protein